MVTGNASWTRRNSGLAAGVLVLSLAGGSTSLWAKTYVIPHVFEQKGRIASTPFVFDTTLFFTYEAGLAGTEGGTGAQVALYLFDPATDQPLLSETRSEVCNPCVATLDAVTRKVALSLDDLIEAAGGFARPAQPAYAVIVVDGDDENVALQGFVTNAHTSPFDLSVFGFEPQPLQAAARLPGEEPSPRRVFVLPHVLEKSGRVADTQYTFDTTLFMTYAGGLAGAPAGSGATVEVYLYDDASGQPMVSATGEAICNPCSYGLGAGGQGAISQRKLSIRIDDLITVRGGFASEVVQGFAVVVVGGDADNVNLQGFVVNAHTGPFDVSATYTSPQALAAVERKPDDPTPSPKRTHVMPHVLEVSGSIGNTQYTFDTTIFATYTAGLAGMQEGPGATVDVYLYDVATGEALRDKGGADVCNPCTRTLGISEPGLPAARKINFSVEAQFGGPERRDVSAVIDVRGDHENVSLQGFVVNSHTSPFDLSIASIQPQPLPSSRPGEPSGSTKRTLVLPHVLEVSGTILDAKQTLDMTITAALAPDLDDPAAPADATVELYLFDESTSSPLRSKTGQDVCAPCTMTLGSSRRAASFELEALAEAAGGLDRPFVLGHGILVVPSDKVAVQGYVVNSHTGPLDLSVFGFEPVPIAAAARAAGPRFLRGDSNADAAVDIADPINTLSFLFQGTATPRCLKTADVNGKTGVDISDAVYLLQFLFLGGAGPVAPFPACGLEGEATELTCEDYPQCP